MPEVITNPRSLKEITAYRDLLNARDDAMLVVDPIVALTPSEVESGLSTSTTSMVLIHPVSKKRISSPTFNKYTALWLEKNLKVMVSQITDLMTADVLALKTRAEEEGGLLGLDASPIIVSPPTITSGLTGTVKEKSPFLYQIMADHISGAGIATVSYAISNAPVGMTCNAATGQIAWTPAPGVSDTSPKTVDITVTTNIGSDTKQLVITVTTYAVPLIQPNQTFTGVVGSAISHSIDADHTVIGTDGVTTVTWSTVDALPSGITLDADLGVLSGTPGVGSEGSYTLSIKVETDKGEDTEDITLTISTI